MFTKMGCRGGMPPASAVGMQGDNFRLAACTSEFLSTFCIRLYPCCGHKRQCSAISKIVDFVQQPLVFSFSAQV